MNVPMRYEPYEGAIFDSGDLDMSRKSIFISIVCNQDPFIINTITSLMSNAKTPENIFISVAAYMDPLCDKDVLNKLENFYQNNKNNASIIILENNKRTTFGELKKIADSNYNKQDYYLSISSRSEFDPHWDRLLIKQFTKLESVLGSSIVLTANPRKFLLHDEVVSGFVYFTNHKIKKSMQREEYDGARIPICGYTEFVNEKNIEYDAASFNNKQDTVEYLNEKNLVKESEKFLKEFKFPLFSNRKFVKDEYIALATGFSSNFVFANAKEYLRINSANKVLIDEHQYDFQSFINLVKKDFGIISLRLIPIYIMEDGVESLVQLQKTFREMYTYEEYINSNATEEIKRMIDNEVINNEKINSILSIDWSELKFKTKTNFLSNNFVNSINFFISMYNFSTYENSLHWNKKC